MLADTTLIRVLVGCVGDVVPDTGSIIAVTPEVADDLVRVGDAVRVSDDGGEGRGASHRPGKTVPVGSVRESEDLL
jgi:hypothetical protein